MNKQSLHNQTQAISAKDIMAALPKDQVRALHTPSNTRAVFSLLVNWLLIASAFALFITWPNPLTFIAGALILGGRQLGLGILTHDCSHNALFASLKANDIVGHWLCGMPLNLSLHDYRRTHMQHHRYTGTKQDPDLVFVQKYPVASASLKRKLTRDITGQTGIRDTIYKLKHFKLSRNYPWLVFHALLVTALILLEAPSAYGIWWVAEIFIFPLVVRLRQIGEHGVAKDRSSIDLRLNTGTTLATWWERLLIAPNHVYYHIEHHEYASIPPYNLAKLHKLLVDGGYYKGHDCIANGYLDVLRRAIKTPSPST